LAKGWQFVAYAILNILVKKFIIKKKIFLNKVKKDVKSAL